MYYKYPRTYHLPCSEGRTSDDKVLNNTDHFLNKRIVITEKRDGENTTLYRDHHHARSIDSKDHESRHWVKKLWSSISYDIPTGLRICGENMYAKHSVEYNDLESYFEVFSMWWEGRCLSWSETLEWCKLLELKPVPVLYEGIFSENIMSMIPNEFVNNIKNGTAEGFVIRLADDFLYEDFGVSVAKYVRANHVQTDTHWMYQNITPNKIIFLTSSN